MNTQLGPLRLEITGSGPVRELIEAELEYPSDLVPTLRTLEISIVHAKPPGTERAMLSGSRLDLRHSVGETSGHGLRLSMGLKRSVTLYTVDIEGDLLGSAPVRATIFLPPNLETWARYTGPVARAVSRDSSTLIEVAAKNVIYEIIDTLAGYRLLGLGASILHSAAMSRDGRCVAITGTGGVGKSTSLLATMEQEPSVSYMSDDMMIVDTESHVYRHPKKVQVYEYNLSQLPKMRSLVMQRLTPRRRRLWDFRVLALGPKQARMRLSAEALFGPDRVDHVGTLGAVVWVKPSPSGEPTIGTISGDILARKSAIALVDELWDFGRLLNLGSLLSPDMISIAEFQELTTAVLSSALTDVPCYELTVPYRSDPTQLVESLSSVVDW
jgi:hypothetical protein